MTTLAPLTAHGSLIEPTILKFERHLPGSLERVWAYLTDGSLRRKWMAAGEMDLTVGASFEFVWRNDELTDPPGKRPDGFGEEHRMTCRILAVEAPRKLVISWGQNSEVSFDLEPFGDGVKLTLLHKRYPDRGVLLNVSAGWHAHLDLLIALLAGTKPAPHWDHWVRLRAEYEALLPG